jgi:flavin reductase (DIM6/NTAB) family NADH-FMN oxidoreductase RutF
MASFHTADRPGRELYKYLIGAVVPRPIAWVASRDKAGHANLAPFSFFNACGYNPPTLAFTVADREEELKDTSRNILEHPEFIVHIVSDSLSEQMNISCGDYGPGVDEFAEAGLTAVPGTVVAVPRVAEALVAFECKLTHHIRLGQKPPHNHHLLGEIVYWHIDDRLLDEQARNPIRQDVLQAVGRMGGIEFARTTDRFEIPRPVIAPEDPRSIPSRKAALAALAKAPLAGK